MVKTTNFFGWVFGVRRQSAATTALSDWKERELVGSSESGVALRLPPHSKIGAVVSGALLLLGWAAANASADPLSLAGSWRFGLDPADVGVKEEWFKRQLPDAIVLPGVLQSQGYGDKISVATPWVLSLYDKLWFLREDYQAYTNAGSVKVPFVCQPPRHYVGAAWYQRDLEIPATWEGRVVKLFLERPHWESRVGLDGQWIGTNNSLCAPHEFELGTLQPGKHTLTVRVDNRMILPYRLDAHSVSDSLNSSWNGIVGRMELAAEDAICIRRLRLDPDLERKGVDVTLFTHNQTGQAVSPLLLLQAVPRFAGGKAARREQQRITIEPGDSTLKIFFPMGEDFERWSEFNPKCYRLIALITGEDIQSQTAATFGMREFKADGTDFVINGQKTYLRGTHHGGDFPLTGYPPTDFGYWRILFRTCREWGLNHVRFHSFCPPEAAFDAADEAGIYLQIEPGMWNEINAGTPMERMLYDETERILNAYGNHPSFVMLSAMNEAHGNWKPCLTKWVEHFRAADPRRLYTPDTGWSLIDAPGPVEGADYLSVGRIGSGRVRGESAWFGRDYSRSLTGVNVPVVAHELGQWCAYPDFSVIKKFEGYMRPGNYEIFRDSAEAHGLFGPGGTNEVRRPTNQDFAWASGRFQLACYKEEIEANLRTPGMAGFQLLDLHDYVGQGTALVGLLDPFWEAKGYVNAHEFRDFCNDTVLLARLNQRVFTTADTLTADVEVARFAEKPYRSDAAYWMIYDARNNVFALEKWWVETNGWTLTTNLSNASWGAHVKTSPIIPVGKGFMLGRISTNLSRLPAPGAYTLRVAAERIKHMDGDLSQYYNRWKFWVYPADVSDAVPKDVLLTSSWDEAEAKLNSGGKVLFLPRAANLDWSCPPLADLPVFWNRLMNPAWGRMLGLWCDTNHPALSQFPTEPNCDWQWTQIIRGVRAINLDRLPRDLQPIVQAIDDWNRNWKLGAVFECKMGKGSLMVCSFDLISDLDKRPVARQLRRSLLDYMAGNRFRPTVEVSPSEFKTVLFDDRIMRRLGATVAGEGIGASSANAAIDGDPNTAWIAGGTGRGASGTSHPHELTITFPEAVAMNGLVLMPRQNDRDHLGDVRNYTIQASDDGQQWREVSSGTLSSTWSPQRVAFAKTITAKQLRFVAQSGFGRDNSTALAELAVMYAGPKLSATDSGTLDFRRSRSTSTDVDEGSDAPAARTNSIPRNP